MRFLVNFIALPVCALLLCPWAGRAATAEPYCLQDPATSIAVPNGGKGACVQETGTSRVLVHYTEDGMLVAQLAALDPQPAADPRLLRLAGDEVGLLYCSASLLDAETGAPTSECLTAGGTPGPDAFVGSGQIQASATVGTFGSLACPSSIQVSGVVNSPGGEAFQIQSSHVRFWNSAAGTTCETIQQDISTDHLGRASLLAQQKFSQLGVTEGGLADGREFPDIDPADLALLESMANLDDHQFQLLQRLTRLTPDGWDALAFHVETVGGAQIGADGSVHPPSAELTEGFPVELHSLQHLAAAVRQLQTDVGRLRQADTVLGGRIDDLIANSPSAELIAGLRVVVLRLQILDDQLVNDLIAIFPDVGRFFVDTAGDLPAFLAFIRGQDPTKLGEGDFQSFKMGCGSAGSECEVFRQRLVGENGLIDELGKLQDLYSQFVDMDLKVEPVKELLGFAPPFSLFVMSRALNQISPRWTEMPATLASIKNELEPILADVPIDLSISQGTALTENSIVTQAALPTFAQLCVRFTAEPKYRTTLTKIRTLLQVLALITKVVPLRNVCNLTGAERVPTPLSTVSYRL